MQPATESSEPYKGLQITRGMLIPTDQTLTHPTCQHTDVQSTIVGALCHTQVTQHFTHTHPQAIEAIYAFPLPKNATMSTFTFKVGERIIKGSVCEQDETELDDIPPHHGSHYAMQAPDMLVPAQACATSLCVGIGMLEPHTPIHVTIDFFHRLRCYEHGTFVYVLPTRSRASELRSATDSTTSSDSDPSQPAQTPDTGHTEETLTIRIVLDTDTEVTITSPSHPIDIEQQDNTISLITLRTTETLPNTDFVLHYSNANKHFATTTCTYRDTKQTGTVLLTLLPKTSLQPEEREHQPKAHSVPVYLPQHTTYADSALLHVSHVYGIAPIGEQQPEHRASGGKEVSFAAKQRGTTHETQQSDAPELEYRVARSVGDSVAHRTNEEDTQHQDNRMLFGMPTAQQRSQAALRYLARTQNVNGSWDESPTASALAVLAFLYHGHTDQMGDYRPQLVRAVRWLQDKARCPSDASVVAWILAKLERATGIGAYSAAHEMAMAVASPKNKLDLTCYMLAKQPAGVPTLVLPTCIDEQWALTVALWICGKQMVPDGIYALLKQHQVLGGRHDGAVVIFHTSTHQPDSTIFAATAVMALLCQAHLPDR